MNTRPPPDAVLPVLQEQLEMHIGERVTGLVRVHKTVLHEEQQFDIPALEHVEIDVDRVPVGRVIDAPMETRTEGDVTIVPVHEERWVLTRQLVLTEELHLRQRRTAVPAPPQHATVRREQVEIVRVPVPSHEAAAPISARLAAQDAAQGDSSPDERTFSP